MLQLQSSGTARAQIRQLSTESFNATLERHTHTHACVGSSSSPPPPHIWISHTQPIGSFLIPIIWNRDVCQSHHMDINRPRSSTHTHTHNYTVTRITRAKRVPYSIERHQNKLCVCAIPACRATCVSGTGPLPMATGEGRESNTVNWQAEPFT